MTCPTHGVAHKTEPHPHIPGKEHRFCPECREEAKRNYAATAHQTDDEIRQQARQQRIKALKPMRPGGSSMQSFIVNDAGILIPKERAQ